MRIESLILIKWLIKIYSYIKSIKDLNIQQLLLRPNYFNKIILLLATIRPAIET